jgi:hypothetical protein
VNDHSDAARAPLTVATDLTVRINGAEASVESTGERLLIQFRSVPDAVRATRNQPAGIATTLTALLRTTDLTVEARVRDRIVAVAGADARPGVVSQLLEVDPVEVRIGGVLGAVGAEASAAVETLSRLLS